MTAGRERAVLCALLLEANRVVTADQLSYALWDHSPPTTAKSQVQICVHALRKTFAAIGLPDRIETRAPGYLLHVADGELDLRVYEKLVAAAQQAAAAGQFAVAASTATGALDVWRGNALAGVDSRALTAAAARLDERRQGVVEDLIDYRLRLGHHHEVIGELREMIVAHPLRERLHAQQMKALFGAGRQAEALSAYRAARQTFIDELGLEPGDELRNLERAILTGRDADVGAARPLDAVDVPAVPRLLPADTIDLVGRDAEVARVCALLDAGAPVIALSGAPGVGKSALAVHVAHRVEGSFPDGQLYIDLRGGTASPVSPGRALDRLLRALGEEAGAIPEGLEERAELYRDRIADRRILLVLDDAADEKHVLPLIPGSPTAGVIVTSPRRLTGIAGGRPVQLDPLGPASGAALLAAVAGAARVEAEPEAVRRLVVLTDGLPLALRIAGARLAARPHWSVGRLVGRLADPGRRLDELCHGGLDVRSCLAAAYGRLNPVAAVLLRSLAVRPERTGRFDAQAAASALGTADARYAEDVLEELVDAQLVTVAAGDRPVYRLPGLVRCYAAHDAP